MGTVDLNAGDRRALDQIAVTHAHQTANIRFAKGLLVLTVVNDPISGNGTVRQLRVGVYIVVDHTHQTAKGIRAFRAVGAGISLDNRVIFRIHDNILHFRAGGYTEQAHRKGIRSNINILDLVTLAIERTAKPGVQHCRVLVRRRRCCRSRDGRKACGDRGTQLNIMGLHPLPVKYLPVICVTLGLLSRPGFAGLSQIGKGSVIGLIHQFLCIAGNSNGLVHFPGIKFRVGFVVAPAPVIFSRQPILISSAVAPPGYCNLCIRTILRRVILGKAITAVVVDVRIRRILGNSGVLVGWFHITLIPVQELQLVDGANLHVNGRIIGLRQQRRTEEGAEGILLSIHICGCIRVRAGQVHAVNRFAEGIRCVVKHKGIVIGKMLRNRLTGSGIDKVV